MHPKSRFKVQIPGKMVSQGDAGGLYGTGGEWPRSWDTRTVIRQIQAAAHKEVRPLKTDLPQEKLWLPLNRLLERKEFQVLIKSWSNLKIPGSYNLLKTSVSVTRRIGQVMFAIEREAGNWGQRRLL